MKLPTAPEPAEFKQEAQQYRQRQKYPGMSYDTFYISLVKNLPSYLWITCRWKNVLKEEGIKWQRFQKIVWRVPLKQWLQDQRTWDDVVRGVHDQIEKRTAGND